MLIPCVRMTNTILAISHIKSFIQFHCFFLRNFNQKIFLLSFLYFPIVGSRYAQELNLIVHVYETQIDSDLPPAINEKGDRTKKKSKFCHLLETSRFIASERAVLYFIKNTCIHTYIPHRSPAVRDTFD